MKDENGGLEQNGKRDDNSSRNIKGPDILKKEHEVEFIQNKHHGHSGNGGMKHNKDGY